jgi:hypothetical protein
MQFSVATYYFTPLTLMHSPEHPVLSVLPLMRETRYHTHSKLQAKLQLSIIKPLCLLDIRREDSELYGSTHYQNFIFIFLMNKFLMRRCRFKI